MLATASLHLGAIPVEVEFDYESAEAEAPDCPGSPAMATITAVRFGPHRVDDPTRYFTEWQLGAWEQAILDDVAGSAIEARASAAIDAFECRREYALLDFA